MKLSFLPAAAAGIIICTLTLTCTPLLANGFKILGVKSTRATSMGEAFTVQADDPSAIAFNPAGLTELPGRQVSTGITLTNGWAERKAPGGGSDGIQDEWQTVPNFYFTANIPENNWAFGLGITAPNGLSSEWREDGFARYVSTYSMLQVVDINPTAAYKVNNRLSLGFGLSYYPSEVTFETMADYGLLAAAPGTMDGKTVMNGEGASWGFNLGAIYTIDERHSLALTYKSPYQIEYDGTLKLTDIPAFLGIGTSYKSDMEGSIDFPTVIVLGYALRPNEKWKLELNIDWTNWDILDSIDVDIKSPAAPLVPASMSLDYDYDNTIAWKLGTEYRLKQNWKLRGGYIYNENATPENTWRPSLPDTDVHFLTAGFGYERNSVTIDTAVQAVFYEDREIDNNVDQNETLSSSSVDGEYENVAVGYSVSLTYRF